jgi:hypothetical protein
VSVRAGCATGLPFEGSGKGDIGSVADLGGDAGHSGPLITQQGPGALHAQRKQVAAAKAARDSPTKRARPATVQGRASGMHGLKCCGDVRVSQA